MPSEKLWGGGGGGGQKQGPVMNLQWKYLHPLLAGEGCHRDRAPAGLHVFALVDATFKV